jgi:hypothetical protein
VTLSSESISFDEGFGGFDQTPIKPPTYFFYLSAASILTGLIIGVFGIIRTDGLSSTQQFVIGGVGYVLTALLPIVFLQISRSKHDDAKANYKERPYDFYGGDKLQRLMLKTTAAGLAVAILPIWIFFSPIAERLV